MAVRERGSLLIITLWMVTILATLAVAISRHLSIDVQLTKYRLAHEQATALARDGVYLAMQRLEFDLKKGEEAGEGKEEKHYDWLGDEWALPFEEVTTANGRGHIRVLWVLDENRFLNLNAATAEQLGRLMNLPPESAQIIIDAYDPPPGPNEPPELTVEVPPSYYYPKNHPLATIEELVGIPNVSAEMFWALAQWTYPFKSGSTPPLNINTVPAEVLLAVVDPSMDNTVAQLVARRPGEDGVFGGSSGTNDDCKATSQATLVTDLVSCSGVRLEDMNNLITQLTQGVGAPAVQSSLFRVRAEGVVDAPKASAWVEAVVQRQTDGITIVAWKES